MEQLGINRRIRFLTAVKDVGPILGASDIAVTSSLMENLSMAVAEALVAVNEKFRQLDDMFPQIDTKIEYNHEYIPDVEKDIRSLEDTVENLLI